MKLSTLLELIGSGTVLLAAGVGLGFVGLGFGLNAATGLPLWASFCGLGLLMVIAGCILVGQGAEQAEEQVKAVKAMSLPMLDKLRSPWLLLGASVVGGLVLQRLLRGGGREIIVENRILPQPDSGPIPSAAEASKPKGFSLSNFFGDQMKNLGSVAAEAAVAMAIQSLGIPSVKEIVNDLIGSAHKPADGAEQPQPSASSRAKDYAHTGRGAPSHNGFNRVNNDDDPSF